VGRQIDDEVRLFRQHLLKGRVGQAAQHVRSAQGGGQAKREHRLVLWYGAAQHGGGAARGEQQHARPIGQRAEFAQAARARGVGGQQSHRVGARVTEHQHGCAALQFRDRAVHGAQPHDRGIRPAVGGDR
jgi:hypothetical protein